MDRFELAKNLIKAAGESLRTAALNRDDVHFKNGHKDLVTLCDKQTEEFLRGEISKAFPGDCIVGEEFPDKGGSGHTWYIDPIDGTSNFVCRKRDYAISIACCLGETPAFSLVLDVAENTLYWAVKGKGAYKNDTRITVSSKRNVSEMLLTTPDALAAFLVPHSGIEALKKLSRDVCCVRCLGSVALELCQVACGEADIFAAVHSSPWDHNGARLIVTEAGGAVRTLEGKQLSFDAQSSALSCNSEETMEKIIKSYL